MDTSSYMWFKSPFRKWNLAINIFVSCYSHKSLNTTLLGPFRHAYIHTIQNAIQLVKFKPDIHTRGSSLNEKNVHIPHTGGFLCTTWHITSTFFMLVSEQLSLIFWWRLHSSFHTTSRISYVHTNACKTHTATITIRHDEIETQL